MKSGAFLAACLGLVACGKDESTKVNPYAPGSLVDVNADGKPDGYAVDSNGDGISDGVDTTGDGKVDVPLPGQPAVPPQTPGNNTGGGGDGVDNDPDNDGIIDAGTCEKHALTSNRLTPDVLIVLDRSGSMEQEGRWEPSVNAVQAATAELDAEINFGLMAFPGAGNAMPPMTMDCSQITDIWERLECEAQNAGGGFGGDAECEAGSLVVPIGANKASEISVALDAMESSGGTPTAPTLEAAHELLGSGAGVVAPDEEAVAPKFVLLVTDGAPNYCMGGGRDEQAEQDAIAAVQALADDGIPTYVVGYETNVEPLRSVMNQMAVAGNTGMNEHIEVSNEQELVQALQDIAGRTVSCTFVLDQEATDPSFVAVQVDGKPIYLNEPDGWTLGPDMRTVEIRGASCDALRSGTGHTLVVEVQCQEVVPF